MKSLSGNRNIPCPVIPFTHAGKQTTQSSVDAPCERMSETRWAMQNKRNDTGLTKEPPLTTCPLGTYLQTRHSRSTEAT